MSVRLTATTLFEGVRAGILLVLCNDFTDRYTVMKCVLLLCDEVLDSDGSRARHPRSAADTTVFESSTEVVA